MIRVYQWAILLSRRKPRKLKTQPKKIRFSNMEPASRIISICKNLWWSFSWAWPWSQSFRCSSTPTLTDSTTWLECHGRSSSRWATWDSHLLFAQRCQSTGKDISPQEIRSSSTSSVKARQRSLLCCLRASQTTKEETTSLQCATSTRRSSTQSTTLRWMALTSRQSTNPSWNSASANNTATLSFPRLCTKQNPKLRAIRNFYSLKQHANKRNRLSMRKTSQVW